MILLPRSSTAAALFSVFSFCYTQCGMSCCAYNLLPMNQRHPNTPKSRTARKGYQRVFATSFPSDESTRATTVQDNGDDVDDSSNEQKKGKNMFHVVIVGGGVGGLAVACRIASSLGGDCTVKIYEKNNHIGGRCGSFETTIPNVGIFRHERGPSLLLLPDVYKKVFEDCSSSFQAEDYGLTLTQCVPAYQVIFEDGDTINVGYPRRQNDEMTDEERKSREKMDVYESDGSSKWDEYMQINSAFLNCGLPNFIEEKLDLFSFPSFLYEALKDSAKAWPLKPHSDVLDAIFESEKMKSLAAFQDLYVGLEPYRNDKLFGGGVFQTTAPAVFGLLAAIELHPNNNKSGVFAPIGGFQSVTNALERLANDLNIEIHCSQTVTSIKEDGIYICDTTTNYEGVLNDKENESDTYVPADLVIVNADLPYATKSLVGKGGNDDGSNDYYDDIETETEKENDTPDVVESHRSLSPIYDWDDSFSFSSGVISFHWSIVGKTLDALNTHNVFLMAQSRFVAEESWKVLREEGRKKKSKESVPTMVRPGVPFNFYAHRSSKSDSTAVPDGCDSLMVLVPCPTLLRDSDCATLPREEAIRIYTEQFSDDVVSMARQAVLERLSAVPSLENLSDYIQSEVVDTPATWADQFNLAAGTPFALSHGFAQLSLTRPGQIQRRKRKGSNERRENNNNETKNNILYCGASTRPGNGVPLVLIGAEQVAKKAIKMFERAMENEEGERTI